MKPALLFIGTWLMVGITLAALVAVLLVLAVLGFAAVVVALTLAAVDVAKADRGCP